MNKNLEEFMTYVTDKAYKASPLTLSEFRTLFLDVMKRKPSLKELNFFMQLLSGYEVMNKHSDDVDDLDVAEFIIRVASGVSGAMVETLPEVRVFFSKMVERDMSVNEMNFFMETIGKRKGQKKLVKPNGLNDMSISKFIFHVAAGNSGILVDTLDEFQSFFPTMINREASLKEMNFFMRVLGGGEDAEIELDSRGVEDEVIVEFITHVASGRSGSSVKTLAAFRELFADAVERTAILKEMNLFMYVLSSKQDQRRVIDSCITGDTGQTIDCSIVNDGEIAELIVYIASGTTGIVVKKVTKFCSIFLDIVGRKPSVLEINLFMNIRTPRLKTVKEVYSGVIHNDVVEFILYTTCNSFDNLLNLSIFRAFFFDVVARTPTLAETNLFLHYRSGGARVMLPAKWAGIGAGSATCKGTDAGTEAGADRDGRSTSAACSTEIDIEVAKFIRHIVNGLPNTSLKEFSSEPHRKLSDFRALFADTVGREAGLCEINMFLSEVLIVASYNVRNGLSGMCRDVVLRLCSLMKKKGETVRMVIGMCKTCFLWKNHAFFQRTRISWECGTPSPFHLSVRATPDSGAAVCRIRFSPNKCLISSDKASKMADVWHTTVLDVPLHRGIFQWSTTVSCWSYGDMQEFCIGVAFKGCFDKIAANNAYIGNSGNSWAFCLCEGKGIYLGNVKNRPNRIEQNFYGTSTICVEVDCGKRTLVLIFNGNRKAYGISNIPTNPLYFGASVKRIPVFASVSLRRLSSATPPTTADDQFFECN